MTDLKIPLRRLLALLPTRRPTPPLHVQRTALEEEDDRERCCGWFDSSHALQAGLELTEHAANDAAVAALPLGDWLALQLGGLRLEPGA